MRKNLRQAIKLTTILSDKFGPQHPTIPTKVFGLSYWYELEDAMAKDANTMQLCQALAGPYGEIIYKAIQIKKGEI